MKKFLCEYLRLRDHGFTHNTSVRLARMDTAMKKCPAAYTHAADLILIGASLMLTGIAMATAKIAVSFPF